VNNMPRSEGSDVSDRQERRLIGILILIINVMTLVWPIVRKVLTGTYVGYYEKLVWCLSLPRSCYMKYCGGEKRAAARVEKEKQACAERRRNAGVRRVQSMLDIDGVRRVQSMLDMDVKVGASLVFADLDKAKSSQRLTGGNTDGHGSTEHGPNAEEVQSRTLSSTALEDARMAVEATNFNRQNGSTAGNSNGNGTHTAGPTGAQATALKADILKCMAEAIQESKAPDSTLHKPVRFKLIRELLHSRNLDVDKKKLQKLFDECDTDRVSEERVRCLMIEC